MSEYLTKPIGRKEYWISIIVSWIIVGVIAGILNVVTDSSHGAAFVGMLGWVYWIMLQAKRLRDAGRSMGWLGLNLLTIVGIVVIGCFPSASAKNEYNSQV